MLRTLTFTALAAVALSMRVGSPRVQLYRCAQDLRCKPSISGLPLDLCQQACALPKAKYTCQDSQCVVSKAGVSLG